VRPRRHAVVLAFATAALLVTPSLSAQNPAGLIPAATRTQLAALVEDCRATPILKAESGGALIDLRKDAVTRIPYGVRYRFRHRVPQADFVYVTLEIPEAGAPQTVAAEKLDDSCYDVLIPALPVGVSVNLRETQGYTLRPEQRETLAGAVHQVLAAYLEILYSGRNVALYGNSARLRAALDTQLVARGVFSPFAEFRVMTAHQGLFTTPLDLTVKNLFLAGADALTALPDELRMAQQYLISAAPPGTGLKCVDADRRRRYQAVLAQTAPLTAAQSWTDIAPLFSSGALPVADSLVDAFGADAAACTGLPGLAAAGAQFLPPLKRNRLQPLLQAVADARRVVEQTFQLVSTELFPGATTTLQRYGQVDVSNAFFGESDARILTTISFYPGDLRYGGEIQPHSANDRWVVSLGYSLTAAMEADDEDSSKGKAYTAGLGYRLNPRFSIGAGRWFSEEKKDGWYLSFSGDLGMIPGLQQLLVRSPNQ
jgi:hypothetical protein